MCSMNWETCSFMRVRHVPTQGILSGGGGGGNSLLQYTSCSGVSCHGSAEPTKAHQFQTEKGASYIQLGILLLSTIKILQGVSETSNIMPWGLLRKRPSKSGVYGIRAYT